MKKLIVMFTLMISMLTMASGQFTKFGGGLGINSGFHFNNEQFPDHKTGNPLIFLTGIYELSLPIHISPSVNIYIPNITTFSHRVNKHFHFSPKILNFFLSDSLFCPIGGAPKTPPHLYFRLKQGFRTNTELP